MKAVDTNILARLILQDDPAQVELARLVVAQPFWISSSVWIELGWVLEKRLRLDRMIVGEALSTILALETTNTADRDGLEWAIARYRAGADWADMVHIVAARGVADVFVTFDGGIEKQMRDSPIAVEHLG